MGTPAPGTIANPPEPPKPPSPLKITELHADGVVKIESAHKVKGHDIRGASHTSYSLIDYFSVLPKGQLIREIDFAWVTPLAIHGLTFQRGSNPPYCRLFRVVQGTAFFVFVSLLEHPDRGAQAYGKWASYAMDATKHEMLYAPPWFACGFMGLREGAIVMTASTAEKDPAKLVRIRWDDPAIGIRWPMQSGMLVGKEDREAPGLNAIEGWGLKGE